MRIATAMSDARTLLQNRPLGILLRLGATLGFGVMAAGIKLADARGVSLPEIGFYRFAFSLPPLLAWMALTRDLGAWRTDRPMAHLWRGVVGLMSMIFGFAALTYLPLAESATIGFAAPLFAVVLSALVLAEPVGRYRWSAVALGFVGVLIVMQPSDSHLPAIGLVLAIGAAICTAGATITIRQIGRTESTPTIVLWFTLFAMAAMGLLLPFYGQWHDATTWTILLVVGLAGGIAQLFMTSALRFAPVSVVAPFDYTQLLWAVLFGWLVWDTQPPSTTWAGASVIIASGLYTLYREHKLGREKPPAEPL